MLLDAGIDPQDVPIDHYDSDGYWKFGEPPAGFDGPATRERGVIPKHWVPWPEGFDVQKFRWAVSVMHHERNTGKLVDPPIFQVHWADAIQYRSITEQVAAYYTWRNLDPNLHYTVV
jgi:hypothetical protein